MKNNEIHELITALLAAIEKHEQEETKKNNSIVDKIGELEKRLKTAEENIDSLETEIDKHLN